MTFPIEVVASPDIWLWRLGFAIASGLIPFLVLAYLCHPARIRMMNVDEVVRRTEAALKNQEEEQGEAEAEVRGKLEQYQRRVELQIRERFWARNYILPLGFLVFVLSVGFFVVCSRVQPLVRSLSELNGLIARIEPGVFAGFLGGSLYALYSVVTRYRSQDIPPVLVLQLSYQVLLAAAVGYFAPRPWLAFAAGFVPYAEVTNWLRQTAQTWLGATSRLGQVGASRGQALWTQGLDTLQGIAPPQRERLGEEGILTIENLALANPLLLCLVTSYSMAQIIDWIDQAYLRLYVSDNAAVKLAARGILGGIELTEVTEDLAELTPAEADAVLDSLAAALDVDRMGAKLLLKRIEVDSQVELLSVMWSEFGAT